MNSNKKRQVLKQPKIFQLPKEKGKNIWPKVLTVISLAVIATIGLIYFIFFSSVFTIKNIEMVGSQREDIKQIFEQYKGKNLFSFNAGELEKQLENANHNIVNLKIYRGIPDTIRVKLEDREPKMIWQTGAKKYLVDAQAIAYAETKDDQELPLVIDEKGLDIQIPIKIAASEFIDFVRSAQKDMQPFVGIKNFEVGETTFQVTMVTDTNLKILLNTLRPLSEQTDAFTKVYSQHKEDIKEYIDLRVEGKVYYR